MLAAAHLVPQPLFPMMGKLVRDLGLYL